MAVVAVKSGPITNRDATPRVMNNSGVDGGLARLSVGTVETANGDDIASTFRFFQIPSNAVVHSLKVFSDDNGSSAAAMDVGIYQTTENGGAVVDADHFASAVALHGGALVGVELVHESNVNGLEDAEKPLWQALGLSADPCRMYDVVATLTGASDAAATITLKAAWAN